MCVEYTQYTIFKIKTENHPELSLIFNYGIISKRLINEFKTTVVNESSVFEPLKVYKGFSPGQEKPFFQKLMPINNKAK